MSVLDDLFSQALDGYDSLGPRGGDVFVNSSVTIAPSSNLQNGGFSPLGLGWVSLGYVPGKEIKIGRIFVFTSPFFEAEADLTVYDPPGLNSGSNSQSETVGLTITGPSALHVGPATYTASVTFPGAQPVSFTLQADPTTNVVYGPAGTSFITISFGIVEASPTPP